ncbi:uncharacterized protein LOC133500445 [Syngnathoides biaculeatus]|uniref:uncharacterized protein LOC133500445 n=1 Tax=Syngnathoides biaculeatus TaxID=300417 RepID=UPI002ADE776B|nr:uncharacterized protein LOC133500445 [Syngnathoides biaculeatus]
MKSFERLALDHLKSVTGPQLDPLQFAYRANRSADGAVNMVQRLPCHLQVDLELPHKQDTTGEAGGHHLIHAYYQHDDTTVIGLIKGSDESVYRQEVARLELLVWSTQPGIEHTKDCRDDCGLPEASLTTVTPDAVQLFCVNRRDLQVLGKYIFRGPKVGRNINSILKKRPAKDVLLVASEEARPVTRSDKTVPHSGYPISTVYLYYTLIWGLQDKL